jgi:hypothetical protein
MDLLVFSYNYTQELTSSALQLLDALWSSLYEAKVSTVVVSHSPFTLLVGSYVTTDVQSVSPSWNKAPIWGLTTRFLLLSERVYWCGALSLMRGRVCLLQLLLALAIAVILGSESRGTRDHILLSFSAQSQSYFTTGRLPPISLSWHQASWDLRPEIFPPPEPLR